MYAHESKSSILFLHESQLATSLLGHCRQSVNPFFAPITDFMQYKDTCTWALHLNDAETSLTRQSLLCELNLNHLKI